MLHCLIVGAGGFAGAVCRYLISLLPLREPMAFPLKTLATNVIGAFIIGLIAAAALKGPGLDPRLTLLLKTGFCGGFTTFSTFALEAFDLMGGGKWGIAGAYMVLSVLLCVAAVLLAETLVGR